jgi:nucleotide-binding universal stress UspA family protein
MIHSAASPSLPGEYFVTYATLMVNLAPGEQNASLLKVTGELAERFRATVVGIAVRQPLQLLYNDALDFDDAIERDFREIERELEAAEAEFRSALLGRASKLEWRSSVTVGPLFEYLAHEVRAADLVITGPSSAHQPLCRARHVNLGSLLMQIGRPLLIVPQDMDRLRLRRVLVCWKDKRETRRVISDVLPLLRLAEEVTVVEIAAKIDLAAATRRVSDVGAWLGRHGVVAESVATAADGNDAEQLEAFADAYRADIIVGGAYGHSQLREVTLGGVTRDLLLRAERCAFVSH